MLIEIEDSIVQKLKDDNYFILEFLKSDCQMGLFSEQPNNQRQKDAEQ